VTSISELAAVAFLGLFTTSSNFLGAAIGLYVRFPRRALSAILAFAAGALISALAIELAYGSAQQLHHQAFGMQSAWASVGSGFALGAAVYYSATLFLENKGGAVRLPTRFHEYAVGRKQQNGKELLGLLSKCDLLRHLPPEGIEAILPYIRPRRLDAGEILFRTGDQGDTLYIVAHGSVEVLADSHESATIASRPIATLGEGQAFGEMALLTGDPRTATIRAATKTELLEIGKDDFEQLVKKDQVLAKAVQHLSHERAINNLSSSGLDPLTWARIARNNLQHVSRNEAHTLLVETGHGAGLAIVLGNILDTIPGCLVIGAKFNGITSLSLTLGMFLGGIPEAAASASMLRRANYRPRAIFALWSTVLVAGVIATVAGKLLIGSTDSLIAIYCQAIAGGAVLALVVHAMIPEAIHGGGSVVVLPTVGGFLFALYLALLAAF